MTAPTQVTVSDLFERARDFDCSLWAVWIGSTVVGWCFTCRPCSYGRRRCRSATYDSATEAFERARDHWNVHQQVGERTAVTS